MYEINGDHPSVFESCNKICFLYNLVNIFFFKWLWPRGVVDISSWIFDNVTAE